MNYKILQGDNRETLKTLEDDSIDAIVTDPPYGIEFLGKDWDANTGAIETWQECLRVLKPGGYILAFSAARTYHHLATNIEAVGFEIRDQLMWLYASGFPKAQDIGKAIQRRQGVEETQPAQTHLGEGRKKQDKYGNNNPKALGFTGVDVIPTSPEAKQWAGWKTALKPSHEPIVMARKPSKSWSNKDTNGLHNNPTNIVGLNTQCAKCGTLKNGTNEKKCKEEECPLKQMSAPADNEWAGWKTALKPAHEPIVMARKPFKGSGIDNVLEHGVGALNIDATRIGIEGIDTRSGGANGVSRLTFGEGETSNEDSKRQYTPNEQGRFPSNVIGEVAEEYQKYFYCPKVSRKERHIGFETPPALFGDKQGAYDDNGQRYAVELDKRTGNVGNNHPTVKPVELMKYLIKLVTPKGGTVLDPFTGSGSTGMAAVELGHTFIGCELDPNYVAIAKRRIEAWNDKDYGNNFKDLFDEE